MADEENNEKMDEVPVEEQPAAGPSATNAKAAEGRSTTIGGVTMDEAQLPLFIVLISSIILLIATGTHYRWVYRGSYASYAISISSISLSISSICLLTHKFAGSSYDKFGKHLCMTTFFWAFIGACFLTFKGPFDMTGNGYFAAWTTVVGSAMSLGMDHNTFKSNVKGLGAVMGNFAASVVFLIACIAKVDSYPGGSRERNNAIYGLSVACFSTVCMLLLMKGNAIKGMMNVALMAVLSVLWIVAACLVTFVGPFTSTSNGYFASWAGFFTALYAAAAAYKEK